MLHEEIEFGHSGEVEFLGLNRWTWKLFAADSSWLHICHMLIFVHLFICSYVHIPHAPQATSSWLGHCLFYHVRTLDLMHWQPCSLHQSNCDMAGNVTCHLHDSMLEDWTRYGTDVWQLQVIYIADAIFAAALPVWVKAQGTDWTMPHSFFWPPSLSPLPGRSLPGLFDLLPERFMKSENWRNGNIHLLEGFATALMSAVGFWVCSTEANQWSLFREKVGRSQWPSWYTGNLTLTSCGRAWSAELYFPKS